MFHGATGQPEKPWNTTPDLPPSAFFALSVQEAAKLARGLVFASMLAAQPLVVVPTVQWTSGGGEVSKHSSQRARPAAGAPREPWCGARELDDAEGLFEVEHDPGRRLRPPAV